MQEQQSKEVTDLHNVVESRKEWSAPRLRVASVERETQSSFKTGGDSISGTS